MTEFEKFRQKLEQELLPDMFYQSKTDMLNAMLDKEGKFFSDLYLIYAPVSDIVYKEEDFKITPKRVMSDNKMMYFVVAEMPDPTTEGHCKKIYFCYDTESEKARYYTTEYSKSGIYQVCSLNKNMKRTVHDIAPQNEEQELQKIGNLFLFYARG